MMKKRTTTLVRADKQLVKEARAVGANVKIVVDIALKDYIKRNKALKK